MKAASSNQHAGLLVRLFVSETWAGGHHISTPATRSASSGPGISQRSAARVALDRERHNPVRQRAGLTVSTRHASRSHPDGVAAGRAADRGAGGLYLNSPDGAMLHL